MSKYLYTKENYRLKLTKSNFAKPIHWLFLPGGPGLGSESLLDLVTELNLQGNSWLVDYPGDGSNKIENADYSQWNSGLESLVKSLKNVVIVAHSFGGMLTLATPTLEKHLSGLVLLNTAPTNQWMEEFSRQAPSNSPEISELQQQYAESPNNLLFKKLTIASAPYFFTEKSLEKGKAMLTTLPYQHLAYDWAAEKFHPYFKYQWIPEKIPTLIMGSNQDHITPFHLFSKNKNFQRENIQQHSISGGHFSWYDDIDSIQNWFESLQKKL